MPEPLFDDEPVIPMPTDTPLHTASAQDHAFLIAQTQFQRGTSDAHVRLLLQTDGGFTQPEIETAIKKWRPTPRRAAAPAQADPPEIASLKPFEPNPDTRQLTSIQLDRSSALARPRDLLEQRELLEDACKDLEAHGEAWYAAALEFRAHVEQATGGAGLAAVVGEKGYQLLNTMAKEQKAAMVAFDILVLVQCALCLKVREMAAERKG